MEVMSFFETDRQNHWLDEIKRSDWGAGAFLHKLISSGTFLRLSARAPKCCC